ncbi:Endonuclease, Uma2 family (restriction endonuclease fold) [Methylomagnum ishizawai]|uniref:Endonuclease, Uma2 family (Restriction endonuclease fold) n=1 Tax=Methylomagnum ishizawai TaxID=1760988 RepID=A0A1Y6D1W5_9GAMM|nr:Uma2 family endonuclease [Methylomagnum ishizawai]SMF96591.1 Endonuclease, Uma2 family (restriction endonuclease fold) [Methylomagnum ishizawai]
MAIPQPIAKLDFEDYLAWETAQAEKHEFVRGEIFAMTGARRSHVAVSLNIAAALKRHLRGGSCRVYMADMKLRVEAADTAFYPDVLVTCDRRDHAAELFMRHPSLVVEVLSESTAAYDRGGKFAAYRQLDSLKEYVVVDIEARRVECFRRDAERRWVLYDYSGVDAACEFASLDCWLPLAEVFEDVDAADEAAPE